MRIFALIAVFASFVAMANSASAAPIITLNPLSLSSGSISDNKSTTAGQTYLNMQYATDQTYGMYTGVFYSTGTIESIKVTMSQIAYYTYRYDIKIVGNDSTPVRPSKYTENKKTVSNQYGTPTTFDGLLIIGQDPVGGLDVGYVSMKLPTSILTGASGDLMRDASGKLVANYQFNLQGPASTLEVTTFELTQVPEPMSALAFAAFGLLARRRRRR